ncbi:DNA (cytosine-5-)-methyltransferase [Janibacter limosus]|uniref:DNA (cytosine-5-)-methyltransferase n=1 Tax=Janibacter limosus TaxID=53458 RepID=UPI002153A1BD|nr:DNA (cytosine-5-)-methyltransferase [Janibacter limosus]WKV16692.1 DNA (cytosine-5-)-methyltransferase [Janibacter limosus]
MGGECVFSSEWDKFSQQTYESWHGEMPAGDITQIDPASIPDHDILAAGFPCQPFSIAGVSKKISLGRAHGFADVKQGNLFFELADVVCAKQPSVLLLENVKNLRSHDRGKTWQVIKETLDELGYEVHAQIIDAAGWVPATPRAHLHCLLSPRGVRPRISRWRTVRVSEGAGRSQAS